MKLTQSQSHFTFSGNSNSPKFIFYLSLLIFFTSDVPDLSQFKLDLSDVCLERHTVDLIQSNIFVGRR